MSLPLLARFAAYLHAAQLEPNFKNMACLALWPLGIRPTWTQAALVRFLRDGKALHSGCIFTHEERGYWTMQLAMQAALGHMRDFLRAKDDRDWGGLRVLGE